MAGHQRPPRGVKRPDPAKLHIHPAVHAALSVPATLPTSVDLSPMAQTRKNQGQSGSCTAHSASVALYVAQVVAGFAAPVDPSPHVLYSLSGRIEVPLPGALQDDGRQLADVITAIQQSGLAPQHGPTPDGRNSDVWTAQDTTAQPPNVCLDATADELAAAARCKPELVTHSIDPSASNVEDLVAAALAAKMPIYLGTEVGDQFENLSGDTEAQPDTIENDPDGGGHALVILGYRPAPDGSREYLVINSWGESWDTDGTCWASGAWVKACWELHTIAVEAPPSSDPNTKPLTVLQRIEQALGRLL